MIHFNKDMEIEYKDTFKQMKAKKCPQCGMALLDNYLGFIKHLAVDHEQVMKYVNVNTDRNKDLYNKDNSDKDEVKSFEKLKETTTPTSEPTEEETKVPTVTSKSTDVPTGLMLNESQLRSESVIHPKPESVAPPSAQPESVTPPPVEPESVSPPPAEPESMAPPVEQEPEFDIRAILDSDSDLDS